MVLSDSSLANIVQCSGRKFATGEIILFASIILHQFDIQPVEEDRTLELPDQPPVERFGFGVEFPKRPWCVRLKVQKITAG